MAAAIAVLWLPIHANAISIDFDYRFDDGGFFQDPNRRARLDEIGSGLGRLLSDRLSPIEASGTDTWTARLTQPSTGAPQAVPNLPISANSLTIFVGARDLTGPTLAISQVGTASATGSADWFNTVRFRGQDGSSGPSPTDFGPWGGSISFDSALDWFFAEDISDINSNQFDFETIALHEIFHVLGFGTAPSWRSAVTPPEFTGNSSQEIFGGPVRLFSDLEHWAEGTSGEPTGPFVEALLTPTLRPGIRRSPTTLDFAALEDVGWLVVPEPNTLQLIVFGSLIWRLCGRREQSGER